MEKAMIGICGAYCGVCEYREPNNCAGCQACKGELWHGTCGVAKCCIEKGLTHCGECPELPCDALQTIFNEPNHGDNGERLANLKAWARGEETFIRLGEFGPRNTSSE